MSILIRSIVSSIIASILIFLILVTMAPDSVAFSPNNYGWNGMQQIDSSYSIQYVDSINQLDLKTSSLLLIIQPSMNFSSTYAATVTQYVEGGGTLVVADSYGVSNSLLQQMGINIGIQGSAAIHDSLYNWRSESYPAAEIANSSANAYRVAKFVKGVGELALTAPSPLVVSGSAVNVLALTSPRSFEVAREGKFAISNGPFPVASDVSLGNGTVIVIGDSQIFTNSAWTTLGNSAFARNLFSNTTVYLDTSHWAANSIASIKAYTSSLFSQLSEYPTNYFVTIVFCAVALVVFEIPLLRGTKGKRQIVTAKDTTYSKDSLEQVRRERAKYGVY